MEIIIEGFLIGSGIALWLSLIFLWSFRVWDDWHFRFLCYRAAKNQEDWTMSSQAVAAHERYCRRWGINR